MGIHNYKEVCSIFFDDVADITQDMQMVYEDETYLAKNMIRSLVVVFTGKIYVDDVGIILEELYHMSICLFIYLFVNLSIHLDRNTGD